MVSVSVADALGVWFLLQNFKCFWTVLIFCFVSNESQFRPQNRSARYILHREDIFQIVFRSHGERITCHFSSQICIYLDSADFSFQFRQKAVLTTKSFEERNYASAGNQSFWFKTSCNFLIVERDVIPGYLGISTNPL